MAHARLAPSAAHRWMRCPGSIAATQGLPDTAGFAAAEGTVFHEVAAEVLTFGLDPKDFIGAECPARWVEDGQVYEGTITFSEEMARHMKAGLEWIEAMSSPDTIRLIEERLDLSTSVGEPCFGTADVVLATPATNELVVFDWKYGAGVPVHPEENEQLIMYALGAWQKVRKHFSVKPEDIKAILVIEQPRAPGGGGEWRLSVRDLLRKVPEIQKAARATRKEDAPRIPGPVQCKFCPAAAMRTCEERNHWFAKQVDLAFDEVNADEPVLRSGVAGLSDEQVARLVLHRAEIKKWLDEIHDIALQAALNGKKFPGLKVVLGRRPPSTIDKDFLPEVEQEIEAILGDEGFQRKLLALSKLRQKLGQEAYDRIIAPRLKVGEPKPVLASEASLKPEYRRDWFDETETEGELT